MRSALLLVALGVASAYDLPTNLRNIYNNHKAGNCQKALSGKSSTGAVFCGDIPNALFLKSNGGYDNMDVDCDGADDKAGDCSNDPSGYGETAFKDTVSQYGISDLNANIHPYVVFNEAPFFNPEKYGMKPLSVMAVVCNNQVVSNSTLRSKTISLILSSGTVFGVIQTKSPLLARLPSRWLSCASPMRASTAI